MSHSVGTVQVLATPMVIGSGTRIFNPPPSPAPGGTKFLMLHFQNLNFKAGDQLQVKLGYATDTFTAADGPAFWTRPVNVYAFPGGVEITYTPGGADHSGSVTLDQYGRGERHSASETGHVSFSNCDPFYTGTYEEPSYDPFWTCGSTFNWENAAAVTDASDVRARVARSVGMILTLDGATNLSTCSVTLVDTDKIICAGHCHTPEDALTGSVVFDYQTLADGSRPAGYNPKFYKVKKVLNFRGDLNHLENGDFSLLQLAEPVVGIPAIQMRNDIPPAKEEVFGVHHPNGAVKKLSLPHDQGFARVLDSDPIEIRIPENISFHVTGGTSGSGLFDKAGRITGVLSFGDPCHRTPTPGPLRYYPTATIRSIIAIPPVAPPVTRDVMVVFDRSGSMSSDDGTGRPKIDTARDAVSLFVQLIKAGTGNRVGLVSFSTSASSPVDFGITNVTPASKTALIGPAPFSSKLVGGLMPGGATSIGGGLDAARGQFPLAGTNPRSILLLTDGLENRGPMVHAVEGSLDGISVNAIGLGSESNLNGLLLSNLASTHSGTYMRAPGGITLEKFFSSAFGNIFESGILLDPEFDLPANTDGTPLQFRVCGEETITAVVGWDRTDTSLIVEVKTPAGATIFPGTAGVESATGRSWTFLRIKLPVAGERNGVWSVNVLRPRAGEIPPPTPPLRYFINVIPSGGPKFTRKAEITNFYTGDAFNPILGLHFEDGGWPDDMTVAMTVTRPDTGVGNILSAAGLGAPVTVDADVIPARQATLQAIEKATGKPAINYIDTNFSLTDSGFDLGGAFEAAGVRGKSLPDFLNVEGSYTLYAKATYGAGCLGAREMKWSLHVDVGIDPGKTSVTSTPLPPSADGSPNYQVTFTPKDKYGNFLGPGRGDGFTVTPTGGSTPSTTVVDLGNGSYQVNVSTDPNSLDPPQISITQPGRAPVTIAPPIQLLIYSVKFVCGEQHDHCSGCAPVRPGHYSTEINILNPTGKEAPMLIRPIPLVVAGAASGREPKFNGPGKADVIRLPAHSATMADCCRIQELILGAKPAGSLPLTIGMMEIVSTVELSVTAVYTATDGAGGTPSIEVNQIAPKLLSL